MKFELVNFLIAQVPINNNI